MSYMRGACYIWRDDRHVHLWSEHGYYGWDDTGWAKGRDHAEIPDTTDHGAASGVGIRQEIADEYVVMRLAELVAAQRVRPVIESAVAHCGSNGGCLALQKLATALVSTLEPIGFHPGAAELRDLWRKTAGE